MTIIGIYNLSAEDSKFSAVSRNQRNQLLECMPVSEFSDYFAFSLWAASKKTTIKTEQLIYPLASLVADFGGTLGLFLGFSFVTLWDNLSLLGKAFRVIQKRE